MKHVLNASNKPIKLQEVLRLLKQLYQERLQMQTEVQVFEEVEQIQTKHLLTVSRLEVDQIYLEQPLKKFKY